jgi:hypothetical protein
MVSTVQKRLLLLLLLALQEGPSGPLLQQPVAALSPTPVIVMCR